MPIPKTINKLPIPCISEILCENELFPSPLVVFTFFYAVSKLYDTHYVGYMVAPHIIGI